MPSLQNNLDDLWTRFVLTLRKQHPFLASLAMFARFQPDNQVRIAETAGQTLRVEPEFLLSLSRPEQTSYLLHQLLHLALNHQQRMGEREQSRWNEAADIVVNQIIRETTRFPAAPRTCSKTGFAGYSVEEVYQLLPPPPQNCQGSQQTGEDKTPPDSSSANTETPDKEESDTGKPAPGNTLKATHQDLLRQPSVALQQQSTNSQNYWRGALATVQQLANDHIAIGLAEQNASHLPAGMLPGDTTSSLAIELEILREDSLDWRAMLRHYMIPSRNDYVEFDPRLLHQGLYLEFLQSEQLRVDIIIDTSRSIKRDQLSRFLNEVEAILNSHPDIIARLFYIDVELNGPHLLQRNQPLPQPVGDGGTSFVPYFNFLATEHSLLERPSVVIYFTDGFGEFPAEPPDIDVLWVVPPRSFDQAQYLYCLTERNPNRPLFPFGVKVDLKD
jgi:predicted metal-dependent peptidase